MKSKADVLRDFNIRRTTAGMDLADARCEMQRVYTECTAELRTAFINGLDNSENTWQKAMKEAYRIRDEALTELDNAATEPHEEN